MMTRRQKRVRRKKKDEDTEWAQCEGRAVGTSNAFILGKPPPPLQGVDGIIRAAAIGRRSVCKQYLAGTRSFPLDDLNELLAYPPLDDSLQDGTTAIHAACINGHMDVVKLLIEPRLNGVPICQSGGARIDGVCKRWIDGGRVEVRSTPLHLAVSRGHWEVARYLLGQGADKRKKQLTSLRQRGGGSGGGSGSDGVDGVDGGTVEVPEVPMGPLGPFTGYEPQPQSTLDLAHYFLEMSVNTHSNTGGSGGGSGGGGGGGDGGGGGGVDGYNEDGTFCGGGGVAKADLFPALPPPSQIQMFEMKKLVASLVEEEEEETF